MSLHLGTSILTNTGSFPQLVAAGGVKAGDTIVNAAGINGTDYTSAVAPVVPLDGFIVQTVTDSVTVVLLLSRSA